MSPLRATCASKHRFGSREAALRTIGYIRHRRRPHARRSYTYRCPACHGYHLTRKQSLGRRERRIRR